MTATVPVLGSQRIVLSGGRPTVDFGSAAKGLVPSAKLAAANRPILHFKPPPCGGMA